jgi:probable HAF family extracellular repeat protein
MKRVFCGLVALILSLGMLGPAQAAFFTTLDVPGSTLTIASGISNAGQIVGQYDDAGGRTHGFLLSDGVYTTFDVPGATSTFIASINNSGQFAGTYVDDAGVTHGFLAAVPEPASRTLLGTGVLSVLAYVRKSRRATA